MMLSIELIDFDYRIFKFLNGFAGISPLLDFTFVALAEYVMFLMIAGFALFILFKKHDKSRVIITLQAFLAAFLGRAVIVSFVRVFFFRARPFVAGIVNQLVEHNPTEASFPSGHATVMFALAFSLLLANRKWGVIYLVIALISALSRIVAGVHFPFDILGGILVGFLSAIVMKWFFDSLIAKKKKKEEQMQ
ncbi:phosphatase PAP2 family protein [Candidatus Peregrinibacteria bacterium]|nr:phosphatase PAP2 family protein [Candidatus Peregrinibacteria bacterium]